MPPIEIIVIHNGGKLIIGNFALSLLILLARCSKKNRGGGVSTSRRQEPV